MCDVTLVGIMGYDRDRKCRSLSMSFAESASAVKCMLDRLWASQLLERILHQGLSNCPCTDWCTLFKLEMISTFLCFIFVLVRPSAPRLPLTPVRTRVAYPHVFSSPVLVSPFLPSSCHSFIHFGDFLRPPSISLLLILLSLHPDARLLVSV